MDTPAPSPADETETRRITAKRWAIGGGAVAGAIAIGSLIGFTLHTDYGGKYALPTAGAFVPAQPPPAPVPAPVVPPVVRTPPLAVQSTPPPVAPSLSDETSQAPQIAQDDDDTQDISRAIEHATRKALRRGETVSWHKNGASGYIVVSEPQAYRDGFCRNVEATIIGEDGQTRSSAHRWCSPDGDDWEPGE